MFRATLTQIVSEIRTESGRKTEISWLGSAMTENGNGNGHGSFVFGDFFIEFESQIICQNGDEIHLANRPFQVLSFLVKNNDRVVSRRELLDRFWDGHDVYDDALRKCVGTIRKALADEEKPPRYIETRYGGGYRFVADVKPVGENGKFQETDFRTTELIQNSAPPSRYLKAVATAAVILAAILTASYFYRPRQQFAQPQTSLVASTTNIRSIAVMPIRNLTGDITNEYFSDGLTESVITQLSRVRELRTISRSSTFIYKDKEIDPREIGKQLNVDALLEGGVQRIGENVNIRVRLVSTTDGSVLWTSNDYERPVTSAYDLQDIIACNLAAELRTEICGVPSVGRTTDGLAYQEYLKGRFEWNKRTAEGIKRSIEHYEKAIAFDPNYALAFTGLADSYVQGVWHVPFDEKVVLPKASAAALRAIELDDSLAEAHTANASVAGMQWNWSESERELARAIEIDPRNARAYHVQAFAFMLKGRYDESIASINRAEELDPLNLVIKTDKGELLWSAERTDEAFEQWRKTLEIDPNFIMALEHRAVANEILGQEAAAIDDYSKAMKLKGQPAEQIADFRQKVKKAGIRDFRRKELSGMLASGKQPDPMLQAFYQSLLGSEAVFRSLETAYNDHSAKIVLMASPPFWKLRGEPRYQELMKRIGLR